MLRTAPTSRGHVAVTGGQGSGQRGLAQYPEEGVVQRGQGRGGEEEKGGGGAGGAHEALWCHRNVRPCRVQSLLAVIF